MSEALRLTPAVFRTPNFDASKRYLRNGVTMQSFPLARGPTLGMQLVHIDGWWYPAMRYNLGGRNVATAFTIQPGIDAPVYWVIGPAFEADYDLVTT